MICLYFFQRFRDTLQNYRPLLTNILEDLIESNRWVNRTENGRTIKSIDLFGNACIRNLIDGCYDIQCRFSHDLPSSDQVLLNLESATIEQVSEAYNELLLHYPVLMEQYFRVFCVFYGRKKFRTQLLEMSHVCAQSDKPESFMQEIVNAFVSTGMPYSTSVDWLIKESTAACHNPRYRILALDVALDLQNTKLLEHLHHFENVFVDENCFGHKESVDKLLQISLYNSAEPITEFILKVLKKCTITTYLRANQKHLKLFLDTARMCGHREAQDILHRIAATNMGAL